MGLIKINGLNAVFLLYYVLFYVIMYLKELIKMIRTTFYMSEELRSRLKVACAKRKISMSKLIVELLENWLTEQGE